MELGTKRQIDVGSKQLQAKSLGHKIIHILG
jgi:hypothetical protein